MTLRSLLLGVIALPVLFVAACAPPPELRDPNLIQDDSLATSDPCAAPCWRGITPGVTTWSDALTILEDDATLTDPVVQEDEASEAKAAEFQQVDGTAGSGNIFTKDGETVSIVFVRLAPTLLVEDLFATHGEPTYAVGSPFSEDQAIVNLIYPDVPMVVYAFVPGESGSVDEVSELIGALFMTAEDMELLVSTSNLHAWEGFATFETYANAEALEVTPSVTLTPTPAQ
jgi:hypothetical protein